MTTYFNPFAVAARSCLMVAIAMAVAPCFAQSMSESEKIDAVREFWNRRNSAESMLGFLLQNVENSDEGELGLDETQAREIRRLGRLYSGERHQILMALDGKTRPLEDPRAESERCELVTITARREEALLARYAEEMERVLLPHQLALARKSTMRNYLQNTIGPASIPLVLASQLGLSDVEQQKFQDAVERAKRNLEHDLRIAREKAAKGIENSLPSRALSALRAMAGADWYERVFVR
jgi:hypothetical protein